MSIYCRKLQLHSVQQGKCWRVIVDRNGTRIKNQDWELSQIYTSIVLLS